MTPTNADALASLRDIHLPEAVGFWPPAPGWWVALATAVAVALAAHVLLRARRRSLKRAALRELDAIGSKLRGADDASEPALQLAVLLRRVAIARFPRREVAGLAGAEWSHFLLRTGGERGLTEEIVREIARAVYGGPGAAPGDARVDAWIAGARSWIGGVA